MERNATTAHALELGDRMLVVSRFSEYRPVGHAGDLVGPDNERLGVSDCNCFGLLACEARGKGFGDLAGTRGFVDVGRIRVVRDAYLFQKHPPVGRTGSQNDVRNAGKHHDF